jgi:uncharacterized membrane protein
MESTTHPFISRTRRRITSGVAALVPIVVTVAVLRFLFGLTSSILLPFLGPAAQAWPPAARAALSFGILLVVVYVLGELAWCTRPRSRWRPPSNKGRPGRSSPSSSSSSPHRA